MSWVEKQRDPETGVWIYTEHGTREEVRRVSPRKHRVDKSIIHRGQGIDFSRGPVRMYTEPMKGQGPVDAPAYADNGRVALFRNMQEIHEYQAKTKDSSRPVSWDRS